MPRHSKKKTSKRHSKNRSTPKHKRVSHKHNARASVKKTAKASAPIGCAPHRESNDVSCFTKDSLVKIAKTYNQKTPNHIPYSGKSKSEIWHGIRNKFANNCGDNEVCWLDNDFMKNSTNREQLMSSFRPKMPHSWKKNKFEWLATSDINSVMDQYEQQYPSFKFLGTVPSDCPTGIYCELSNIKIPKLEDENITKLGVVFNLDKHNQPGSHWVALFMHVDNGEINYYDSYGHPPIKSIHRFMSDMGNKLNQHYAMNNVPKKARLRFNRRRHQYGGSECGIYSMNFLIESLKGKDMDEICNRKIPDRVMNQMRQYLYRTA